MQISFEIFLKDSDQFINNSKQVQDLLDQVQTLVDNLQGASWKVSSTDKFCNDWKTISPQITRSIDT